MADLSKNVNAAEDVLATVTKAHVLSAAMKLLKMIQLSDVPCTDAIPDDIQNVSKEECKRIINSLSRSIIEKYMNIKADHTPSQDKIQAYASEILSLGLFHEEFRDAIREGDGERESVTLLEVHVVAIQTI